jgi:hypothetical protein
MVNWENAGVDMACFMLLPGVRVNGLNKVATDLSPSVQVDREPTICQANALPIS